MTELITLPIPKELQHPFFFSIQDEMNIEKESLTKISLNDPFLYEIAYYSQVDALKPWERQEEFIPLIVAEWAKMKPLLSDLFSKRETKQIMKPMQSAVRLFLAFVYWGNGLPVQYSPSLISHKLRIKPVNIDERLTFIIARPVLHHSFIQLNGLMVEMEKQYVKAQALKKASKH